MLGSKVNHVNKMGPWSLFFHFHYSCHIYSNFMMDLSSHLGFVWGKSPMTDEFPKQRACNAEKFLFDDVIMFWL